VINASGKLVRSRSRWVNQQRIVGLPCGAGGGRPRPGDDGLPGRRSPPPFENGRPPHGARGRPGRREARATKPLPAGPPVRLQQVSRHRRNRILAGRFRLPRQRRIACLARTVLPAKTPPTIKRQAGPGSRCSTPGAACWVGTVTGSGNQQPLAPPGRHRGGPRWGARACSRGWARTGRCW